MAIFAEIKDGEIKPYVRTMLLLGASWGIYAI
jgi:hypothetical protein